MKAIVRKTGDVVDVNFSTPAIYKETLPGRREYEEDELIFFDNMPYNSYDEYEEFCKTVAYWKAYHKYPDQATKETNSDKYTGYIVRDRSGSLLMTTSKELPVKEGSRWKIDSSVPYFELFYQLYPEINFDSEPVKVELSIKKL